jgi:hypothetical protein
VVAQRSDGEEGALQVRENVGTAGIARQVREREESGVRGLDDATVWQRDTDTDGVMNNIVEGVGIGKGDEVAETSYKDKAGKYMGQRGIVLPRVEGLK